MTDDQRERRLGDASDLRNAIDALVSVSADHRKGFMHDRLMSAIDGICTQHSKGGKVIFTGAQILAIKDIAFQIVFILDPKSKAPKGFFGKLRHEFAEATAIQKIGYVVATLVFLYGLITGGYSVLTDHILPGSKQLFGVNTAANQAGGDKPVILPSATRISPPFGQIDVKPGPGGALTVPPR